MQRGDMLRCLLKGSQLSAPAAPITSIREAYGARGGQRAKGGSKDELSRTLIPNMNAWGLKTCWADVMAPRVHYSCHRSQQGIHGLILHVPHTGTCCETFAT